MVSPSGMMLLINDKQKSVGNIFLPPPEISKISECILNGNKNICGSETEDEIHLL